MPVVQCMRSDGAHKTRIIIDLENDVIKLIDDLKNITGTKSRSSIVNQLLRELLTSPEGQASLDL